MTYKKAPVHLTWDANDFKRVSSYFALLVQIDKRVAKTHSSVKAEKEESKEIDKPTLQDIWTRDQAGPFFGLFFFASAFIFNHSLLIKFLHHAQAGYDRYHCINSHQGHFRNTVS